MTRLVALLFLCAWAICQIVVPAAGTQVTAEAILNTAQDETIDDASRGLYPGHYQPWDGRTSHGDRWTGMGNAPSCACLNSCLNHRHYDCTGFVHYCFEANNATDMLPGYWGPLAMLKRFDVPGKPWGEVFKYSDWISGPESERHPGDIIIFWPANRNYNYPGGTYDEYVARYSADVPDCPAREYEHMALYAGLENGIKMVIDCFNGTKCGTQKRELKNPYGCSMKGYPLAVIRPKYDTDKPFTSLDCTAPACSTKGNAILKSTLKSDGKALPGKSVCFVMDGIARGCTTTDSNGDATVDVGLFQSLTLGDHRFSAEFVGDDSYSGSRTVSECTFNAPWNTQIINVGINGSKCGLPVTLSATLTKETDTRGVFPVPISGATLKFQISISSKPDGCM